MLAASLATGMLTPAALLMRAAGMISPLANMAMYNKMSKEERQQLEEYEKMRQERLSGIHRFTEGADLQGGGCAAAYSDRRKPGSGCLHGYG